jgi:hypothetical protein
MMQKGCPEYHFRFTNYYVVRLKLHKDVKTRSPAGRVVERKRNNLGTIISPDLGCDVSNTQKRVGKGPRVTAGASGNLPTHRTVGWLIGPEMGHR